MKTIPLHGAKARGRVALVDNEDYELVMRHRWHVVERHRPRRRVYGPYAGTNIKVGGKWTAVKMHKLITGYDRTDHINHNGLDNQRHNLRPATHSQNAANNLPRLNKASKYKGVYRVTHSTSWRAAIQANGERRRLGSYPTEEAAAAAYDAAAIELFGSYAHLNLSTETAMSSGVGMYAQGVTAP